MLKTIKYSLVASQPSSGWEYLTELKKIESIILTQTHIFCKQVTAGIEVNPLTDAGFKAKFANGIVIPNNYEITRLVSSLKCESSLNHLCSLKTSSTQIKQSQKKLQKPPYFQKQTIMTSTMQEHWHCQHQLPIFLLSKKKSVQVQMLLWPAYKLNPTNLLSFPPTLHHLQALPTSTLRGVWLCKKIIIVLLHEYVIILI